MPRKILLSAILLLLFSITVCGQQPTKSRSLEDLKKTVSKFKNSRRYVVKYDKFDDVTYITFGGFLVSSTAHYITKNTMVSMGLQLAFKGNGVTSADSFISLNIFFTAEGKDWTFLKENRLQAIADEQRLDFGEPHQRDSDIGRSLFSQINVNEIVAFNTQPANIKTIAESKTAEMRVGKFEFQLKEEHKQMFKDMLSLIETGERK